MVEYCAAISSEIEIFPLAGEDIKMVKNSKQHQEVLETDRIH